MPYKSNIAEFLQNSQSTDLFNSYRILVAIELALKDSGITGQHDIPSMLAQVSAKFPLYAAQLNAHQARITFDLQQLICNDRHGNPVKVPPYNYPYARYTRFQGDWAGASETTTQSLSSLAQTCNSLLIHLQAHRIALGINI